MDERDSDNLLSKVDALILAIRDQTEELKKIQQTIEAVGLSAPKPI